MTAMRRLSVLGLAVLLAAATATADTVITVDDVIPCSVESADSESVRFTGTSGVVSILPTRNICELRLSDSSRVVELAARLPLVSVTLDSGQYVYSPAIRIREMLLLRLGRAREARARGLPWHTDVVDTLTLAPSPGDMTARCQDMDVVLRECGRDDEAAAALLREINREENALHGIRPRPWTCCLSGALGGLLGGCIGLAIGEAINPTPPGMDPDGCTIHGGPVGLAVGCAAGSVIGATVGTSMRTNELTRQHRGRVNDLIRRVNRAVASTP